MKLTLGSCLSLADGWVQFTCTENHTLNQRTFVVCLQLDACSVALESGLWQWQWVSSCAKNGLCWHKGRGHGPNSRQQCQHQHVEQQQSFPPQPSKADRTAQAQLLSPPRRARQVRITRGCAEPPEKSRQAEPALCPSASELSDQAKEHNFSWTFVIQTQRLPKHTTRFLSEGMGEKILTS